MLRSMFSGVSGLRTHQNKMDVIGNNIANVNTAGFKTARATFMDSIYQSVRNSTEGNDIYGGSNPSQLGYGCQLASIDVNHATGSYEPTGYTTDCMINGNGYFLVGPKNLQEDDDDADADADDAINGLPNGPQAPDDEDGAGGAGGVATEDESQAYKLNLTRVGKFTIDGKGYLVDANGNVVYGFLSDKENSAAITGSDKWVANVGQLMPLRVPSAAEDGDGNAVVQVDYASDDVINLNSISIDETGVVSGIGSDGTVYKFGQIAVANVPNPNALENQGNSYYKAVNNTGFVQGFAPGAGTTGKLISGGLEMSNVDLATEFSNMITTQRGFQACSKMITVSDEMLQELVSMKR